MNREDLFKAIGEVDDSLVGTNYVKRKPFLRIALYAAAACLVIGLTLFLIIRGVGKKPDDKIAFASPVPTSVPTSVPTPVPTPDPTEAPTPEPTPWAPPDLTGWKVVEIEGKGYIEPSYVIEPPYVMLMAGVAEALEDPANDGALFKVMIMPARNLNIPIDAQLEWHQANYLRCREVWERIENDPVFIEFDEAFHDWFVTAYFEDCPFKDLSPDGEDFWHDPEFLLTDTLYDPDFPNYYEMFLDYLTENGEGERAELYRPLAEEYWQASFDARYEHMPEMIDDMIRDCERLIDLGYRIDMTTFSSYKLSVTAYLTKEQILNFTTDPNIVYYIFFPNAAFIVPA